MYAGIFVSRRRAALKLLPVRRRPGLEAIAAIDGLVAARLERHFGRLSALAAGGLEHLAARTARHPAACARAVTAARAGTNAAAAAARGSSLRLACRTALGATIRLVLEAFAGKELLLARAKDELAVAVNAVQGFISIHVVGLSWRLISFGPAEYLMKAVCCRPVREGFEPGGVTP